jgi:hypothetical protein
MPLLLAHQKNKKKPIYLYLSQHDNGHETRQDYHLLNSQNNIILLLFQTHNPPIWLASSTPYLHLHLEHPFCIFIFNTHLASSTPHFASSSSTPIWHHLETPHFVSSTFMILCIDRPNLQQLQQQNYHAMVRSSTPVTPMVDEICSRFQRFLFLDEYESLFLSFSLQQTGRLGIPVKKMKKSRGPSSCLDWVSDYTNSLVTNQVSDSSKIWSCQVGQKGCNLWGSDWEFHKILDVSKWVSKTVEVPNSTSFGLGIS